MRRKCNQLIATTVGFQASSPHPKILELNIQPLSDTKSVRPVTLSGEPYAYHMPTVLGMNTVGLPQGYVM